MRKGRDWTREITHRRFYTQGPFTHRHFYTQAFYIQTVLHTDAFTIFYTVAFTQTLLHTKLLPTEAFTDRSFYAQTLLHRRFYTQTLLHTDAFTHRSFYTQTLLHTGNRSLLQFGRVNLISCERVAIGQEKLNSISLQFLAIEPRFVRKGLRIAT